MRLRAHAWLLPGVLALAAAACVNLSPFACTQDLQCDSATGGRCMGPGFCAFPDDGCDSGYRYHASATGNLSGACVEPTAAGTGTTANTPPTTDTETTSDSTSTQASTDGTDTGSTSPVTADGTSDSTGEGSTSTTGGPCGDMPCPCTAKIASGAFHTCAVRQDDVIVCWGRSQYGQLGGGDDEPMFDDEPQPIVAPGAKFVDVSAHYDHTCAITDAGQTWCWGRNQQRQSSTVDNASLVGPTNDGSTDAAALVSVGRYFSCSADDDGRLTCWGDHQYQQLGSPGAEPGPLTSRPIAQGTVLGVAAGYQHACLHTGQAVLCWGRNHRGQNGGGMMGGDLDTPTEVALAVGVGTVSVAAGRHHSCAAVAGGAEVYCWGWNHCGQVDDTEAGCNGNSTTAAYDPTAVELGGTVVQLAGRTDTTCALMDDGSAWCWGGRQGYWVGTDVAIGTTMSEPAQVVVLAEPDEPIVDLSLGFQHACGLAASGRLWCWGSDQYEQLGFNDPERGMRTVEMDLLCP